MFFDNYIGEIISILYNTAENIKTKYYKGEYKNYAHKYWGGNSLSYLKLD